MSIGELTNIVMRALVEDIRTVNNRIENLAASSDKEDLESMKGPVMFQNINEHGIHASRTRGPPSALGP